MTQLDWFWHLLAARNGEGDWDLCDDIALAEASGRLIAEERARLRA
jgi:hypothetical protein